MSKRDSRGKQKLRCYKKEYVKFGFIKSQFDENKPECFLCGEVLSNDAMKPSKMQRHLETKHGGSRNHDIEYFNENGAVFGKKTATIDTAFRKCTSELEKCTEASYIASLAIAKAKKPHSIGEELLKPVLIDVVSLLCGKNAAEKIKNVPLSNDTVKRRIDSMANDCEKQLVDILKEIKFAIQLDETTTITNEALLLVCVRYIATDGDVNQDLLFSSNLDTTTRGEDIFETVDGYFQEKGISYTNLVACCSDGAAAMMGKHRGFTARLKGVAPHCKIIHCMIHRQALAAKKLSPELHDVLQTSVKVINEIKAKALNSRVFQKLCEENDEEHTTLLLHNRSEVALKGKERLRGYSNCGPAFLKCSEKLSRVITPRHF
ncbi:putative SCAN domain-containing protein 3-like [Apostichopus japonicus]|uniref:Putative SCAN domain-containing protein 3-like n=1 Tax=Stichopus japonicus TaxID=307972 RepID=A0A2G8KRB6_STIJA|nr:putative SCAN domain-containing protein 3-like [Apostichopus japonicus]